MGYSSWFYWRRGASAAPADTGKMDGSLGSSVDGMVVPTTSAPRSATPDPVPTTSTSGTKSIDLGDLARSLPTVARAPLMNLDEYFYPANDDEDGTLCDQPRRYKKSLRLSSDKLKSLPLRRGHNTIRFSVTTKYQGTTWCECDLYLWHWTDKLVVSDIDGTITISDVMGHIAPLVGGQWAQPGITKLYQKILNNGYRIMYLSARAIGQSSTTKDYLRSVSLDGLPLPDGPVFLTPSSLFAAFTKEVIEKKPEEFKKSCLNDIVSLFPAGRKPLYAGFGNKINDVWAYLSVGISPNRIFSINHKGELRNEHLMGFRSTYSSTATDLVDFLFPPVDEEEQAEQSTGHATPGNNARTRLQRTSRPGSAYFHEPHEYSAFTFWRSSDALWHGVDTQDVL